jgi:hypothetical protein
MTPLCHTLYTFTLFAALVALNQWTGRRFRRVLRIERARAEGTLSPE